MDSRSYHPRYAPVQSSPDTDKDHPGARCGHTLTSCLSQLLLFGGSTTAMDKSSLNSLQGVTNSVHSFNVLTKTWTRLYPKGEGPSPRACHAATSFGTLLLIQGGIGPSGLSDGDLYMLDTSPDELQWSKLDVLGDGPGPRYGHVMAIVAHRWLVIFGGHNGQEVLGDTWVLDLDTYTDTNGPYAWNRLQGEGPRGRMYASAFVLENGSLYLSGGIDNSRMPLEEAYELKWDGEARWDWIYNQEIATSARYKHAFVSEGLRMHLIGGMLNWTSLVEGQPVIAVLNHRSGEWLGPNGAETSTRGGQRQHQYEVMRRCLHAAVSVGNFVYVYGGLREGQVLEDFLVDEMFQPEDEWLMVDYTQPSSSEPEVSSFNMRRSSSESSMERLRLQNVETEGYVLLQQTPVGLMRTLSLDRSIRQNPHQDLHKRVISTLLRPKNWEPSATREFFMTNAEVEYICDTVEQIFMQEPTALQLKVPIKVFGDIHGQFKDLMHLFDKFGSPSKEGDITHIDYLFLGDYVDRGKHSLEVIMLLLALKIEYPKNIHLIRGNHESRGTNQNFGFHAECIERMGAANGLQAWSRINELFNYLPLAGLIENRILCMHGGIGEIISLDQITSLERPAYPDSFDSPPALRHLLWSDPSENEETLGITENKKRRGGVVNFGPDVVGEFCKRNKIDVIIRGHQCVQGGFEKFAGGKLITVFSATNYCGIKKNAGAILVIGRDWSITPKLVHPDLPPTALSRYEELMEELNIGRPFSPGREKSNA